MNFGRHRTSRLTAADRRGWSIVPRTRLYRRSIAGAATAMLVSVALLAQTSVTSEATWNDAEWVNGSTIGSVSCDDAEGAFATRGEGRALSGSLLGIDLDNVASVHGVEATNNGESSRADFGRKLDDPAFPDSYADPLDVEAIQALDVPLTSVLQLGLDTSAGAANQFGQAQNSGEAAGASGYVTNNGGINLDGSSGGYPELGTVSLSNLLSVGGEDLQAIVGDVADVDLTVGAVAGRASFDACEAAWNADPTSQTETMHTRAAASDIIQGLDREYLASSLTTTIRSDLLGDLLAGTGSAVGNIETTVNGLSSNQGVLNGVLSGVTSLLNGLISNPILSLGNVSVALNASVNTQAIRSLITQPFHDEDRLLTVDPAAGTITFDTAAVLASAFPGEYGEGLNSLPPNTDLLGNQVVVDALTDALGDALDDWTTRVTGALAETINAVTVSATVTVALKVEVCTLGCIKLDIGTITAKVGDSLGALLSGGSVATVTTDLNLGVLGALLRPVVQALVNTLVGGLVSGLGKIVGDAVEGVLGPLRSLPSTVTSLISDVLSVGSAVYNRLFLSGLVSLTVNAQNRPVSGGEPPPDWQELEEGRYDVAALRIELLGAAGKDSVRLYLGRASVGPGCSKIGFASGECAGYGG